MKGKKSENYFKHVWKVKQTMFKKQAKQIVPKLMKDYDVSKKQGERHD